MATLSILNSFSMPSQGKTVTGKQGAAADAVSTSMDLTAATTPAIAGTIYSRIGTLATATYNTIYTAATDFPATFDYGHFWADQDCYIQLIFSATDIKFKVAAKVPFVIPGFGSGLGSAGTTVMSAEPTVTAVAKVVIGNVSGTTLNYALTLID